MVVKNDVDVKKKSEDFRLYEKNSNDPIQIRVKNHYYKQHKFQTVDFVNKMHKKWLEFNHGSLEILECLDLLNTLIDESDPDTDDANIVHAYQTAERLRKMYPDEPWLHLTGLIHDLGKVMSVWGEVQYAVTGDTYPVGCAPVDSIVYGIESFEGNSDLENSKFNTKLGMYKENCGIENLLMCWSHDEYLYQVLINHGCTLPMECLHAIRFHSFYPYHTGGDYKYFETKKNIELKKSIDILNSCDLYSKSDTKPDIEELKPYYQSLVDIYIPGKVNF